MFAQVRQSLRRRALLFRGDHVLIACSGGSDSVALMHLLAGLRAREGFTASVASINHGLRRESAAEVALVAEQARALDLPFVAETLELRAGSQLQERAREARYIALHRLARQVGAGFIAVGHTMDDQAETVLARLLRGAGVAGLAAIEPRRDDGVIRPLIDCRREELRQWLRQERIAWLEDPSNEDRRFERVRIREQLLPLLEEENPQLVEHFAHLADDARGHRELVGTQAEALLERCQDGDALCRSKLLAAPPALWAEVLRRWVRVACTHEVGSRALRELRQLVVQGRGEVLVGGGWRLSLAGDAIVAQSGALRGRSHRSNDVPGPSTSQ